MKKAIVSIVMGCALIVSAGAYAAGDMSNMDMSGGAKQSTDAKKQHVARRNQEGRYR